MNIVQRQRLPIIILILLYFGAAVWMAVRLPAHATPNELLNYEYIAVMRQIRGLPNRGLVDSDVRYTEWHQPPVYFTFAALVGLAIPVPLSLVNPPPPIEVEPNPHYLSTPRGNRNPTVHITPQNTPLLYTSRLAAALLGVLGLAALYRAGRQVFAPAVALLITSLLAFQPNFVHLSGSVNNDMPLVATSAIVLAYAILLFDRLRRPSIPQPSIAWYIGLGLVCALAILTKANGVFVLAYLVILLLASRPRTADRRPRTADWLQRCVAPTLLALGLPWGAWLVLNALRMRDALGLEGSLPVGRVLALSPLDFADLWPYLPQIWRSFWLDWSAGDVGFGPPWLYLFWLVALCFVLLGWLRRGGAGERGSRGAAMGTSLEQRSRGAGERRWVHRWSRGAVNGRRSAIFHPSSFILHPSSLAIVGFLAISYLYFAVKALTVKEAGTLVAEGRWWLPAMAPLAWLAAVGFARWWPVRLREKACLVAAAVPILFLYGLLFLHLPYLYPRAEKIDTGCIDLMIDCLSNDLMVNAGTIFYGEELELLAADIKSNQDVFELSLAWRVLHDLDRDYTISVQTLAVGLPGWQKVAESNSYPGSGLNPTRGWQAGDIYLDQMILALDGALNGPTQATVAVYVLDNGMPLPIHIADRRIEDPPFVDNVIIRPPQPLTPDSGRLPAAVLFGNIASLLAAEAEVEDGNLVVTLWWEARETTAADYTVFVHVLDERGQLVAQQDTPPNNNNSPTSIWQPGDVVRDSHQFLQPMTAVGELDVLVGLYDRVTGERLAASQDGRPLPDNAFRLPVVGN